MEQSTNILDWSEGQELTGCSDLQVRFAQGLVQGLSKTAAARQAGSEGEDATLRSVASRASQSHKVKALLSWARSRGAGPSEIPGDEQELRRLLWRHARSADPSRSIKATEALMRLEEADRAKVDRREPSYNSVGALDSIAEISPVMAALLAGRDSVRWRPKTGWSDILRQCEEFRETLLKKCLDEREASGE